MKKEIRDTYGDPVEIWAGDGFAFRRVYLRVAEGDRPASEASLTPKQAKRIAKALRKAANEASL